MQAHPTRRQAIVGVLRSQHRACDGVAKRHGRRAAGAQLACRDKRGRKGDWEVPFRILSVTTLRIKAQLIADEIP